MDFTREIAAALAAPFDPEEIEFLPRGNSAGKAKALPYLEARSVMNRLDAAVGPGAWSWDYDVLSPDGKRVKGKLTVLGVTKCDAGEAAAEDEPLKSAVSDALKRTAVLFGIGRYLYYVPGVWTPYDSQKKRWSETPRLDPRAVERALAICGIHSGAPSGAPSGIDRVGSPERTPQATAESPGPGAQQPATPAPAPRPGRDAAETRQRVTDALETRHGVGADAVTPASELVCSTELCGAVINKRQHDATLKAFEKPLCAHCAREAGKKAA